VRRPSLLIENVPQKSSVKMKKWVMAGWVNSIKLSRAGEVIEVQHLVFVEFLNDYKCY